MEQTQLKSEIGYEMTTVDALIRSALSEDIGTGDVTTTAVIPPGHNSRALLIAKEACIVAGMPFAERAFQLLNSRIRCMVNKREGSRVRKGTRIAEIRGDTASLLQAERVALNLLQRLSGIASLTRGFVEAVDGFPVKIVDTRKTTPGFRVLEKYAVRTGGGYNHRFGLYDGVLIKDNHIATAGGLKEAVKRVRLNAPHTLKIEAEAKNLQEVREALSAGVDIIMLDNMHLPDIVKAVEIIRRTRDGTLIEASGNIGIEEARLIASSGVDLISVGALTHSAPASDISMKVLPDNE